jgi:hypothetical protein
MVCFVWLFFFSEILSVCIVVLGGLDVQIHSFVYNRFSYSSKKKNELVKI